MPNILLDTIHNLAWAEAAALNPSRPDFSKNAIFAPSDAFRHYMKNDPDLRKFKEVAACDTLEGSNEANDLRNIVRAILVTNVTSTRIEWVLPVCIDMNSDALSKAMGKRFKMLSVAAPRPPSPLIGPVHPAAAPSPPSPLIGSEHPVAAPIDPHDPVGREELNAVITECRATRELIDEIHDALIATGPVHDPELDEMLQDAHRRRHAAMDELLADLDKH